MSRLAQAYKARPYLKNTKEARRRWLTPVILATQEAEIRKILIEASPRQIVHETLSRKNPSQKRLAE
jgi:hypothetical protein